MSDDDYKVGYRNPPLSARFKKGQSGNPKGRRKGVRNLKTELEEELAEKITLRENDRSVKISKQRAILKVMVAKAMKGDTRAGLAVLAIRARLIDDKNPDQGEEMSTADKTLLDEFLEREFAKRARREKSAPGPTPEDKN